MKNAVVFLATGFEEIEALGTIDVLRRGGVRVMMVSITGDRLVIGAHDIPVMADYLFEEADFSCVDALILPGGIPGSNHLNAHAHLKELVKEKNGGRRINRCYLCRTDGFRWSWIAKREKGYLFSFLRANNGRRYPYG